MSQPDFEPQWTVPPAPPGQERPIRGGRVAAGIGIALLAHLVTIGVTIAIIAVAARSSSDNGIGVALTVAAILQVLTFAACLTFGIIWIAKRDKGIGLGLIIGWAVGVIVLPVVGVGICVWAVNTSGGLG